MPNRQFPEAIVTRSAAGEEAPSARRDHWDEVYSNKAETEVSWYQEEPAQSLDLLALAGASPEHSVIDIGGGASRLVDALLARGFERLAVLDLSAAALATARGRLGPAGDRVDWIVADVTGWVPAQRYDIWHDRAALHFLNAESDQAAYVAALKRALPVGGHAILGTFAPDGPEKCSGLPVTRHDARSLGVLLGDDFELVDERRHDHSTPWGSVQRFQFSTFRRAR